MENSVIYAQRLYVIPNVMKRVSSVWKDYHTYIKG